MELVNVTTGELSENDLAILSGGLLENVLTCGNLGKLFQTGVEHFASAVGKQTGNWADSLSALAYPLMAGLVEGAKFVSKMP